MILQVGEIFIKFFILNFTKVNHYHNNVLSIVKQFYVEEWNKQNSPHKKQQNQLIMIQFISILLIKTVIIGKCYDQS